MGCEIQRIQIVCTIYDSDHLPKKDGEQMYADDVYDELREMLNAALAKWYAERGHLLLACEPDAL